MLDGGGGGMGGNAAMDKDPTEGEVVLLLVRHGPLAQGSLFFRYAI